jgi:hypothetical protein
MGGRQGYKDSSEFMNWYNNLSPEDKKVHNRKRYLRSKEYKQRQEKKRLRELRKNIFKTGELIV